jgi:uncharacterized protein (DUF1810 family)
MYPFFPDGDDPFNLERFVTAQRDAYEDALDELRFGQKEGHWMWFVFPQIDGLGSSNTAKRYAIKGLPEAKAYLDHPILGRRLLECCKAILAVDGSSAADIFGCPDDAKLKSSMTLFAQASGPGAIFSKALIKYFAGQLDARTIEILNRQF